MSSTYVVKPHDRDAQIAFLERESQTAEDVAFLYVDTIKSGKHLQIDEFAQETWDSYATAEAWFDSILEYHCGSGGKFHLRVLGTDGTTQRRSPRWTMIRKTGSTAEATAGHGGSQATAEMGRSVAAALDSTTSRLMHSQDSMRGEMKDALELIVAGRDRESERVEDANTEIARLHTELAVTKLELKFKENEAPSGMLSQLGSLPQPVQEQIVGKGLEIIDLIMDRLRGPVAVARKTRRVNLTSE